VSQPKDGYAFVYDIGGFPGMSGGAILDEQGKLVGKIIMLLIKTL
jgi:hypothetical protein